MSGTGKQCATICSTLRPGDMTTRNPYEESRTQRPQDPYGYSGNAWKSSWANQRGKAIRLPEGGPLGDAKDWATSLEFTQWQEQQAGKAIPSQEVDELIRGLIYEPSSPILMEGLEEVKELLKDETPVS